MKVDELEKPTSPSGLSAENRIEEHIAVTIKEPSVCEGVQDIAKTIETQTISRTEKTSDYFAQSSLSFETGDTTNRHMKRICRKRRKDLNVEDSSSDSWSGSHGKRIRTIEPATVSDEISAPLSVEKDQINQNDEKRIHNFILMAADVVRTMNPNYCNGQGPNIYKNPKRKDSSIDEKIDTKTIIIVPEKKETCKTQNIAEFPKMEQVSIDMKTKFDMKVYEKIWTLQNFTNSLLIQPDYGSEIEKCESGPMVDEMNIDVHYGSISNP